MTVLYLLLVTLWGVVAVEACVTGLALTASRRPGGSAGIFLLACVAMAGLAASHWLSLAPRFDPRLPGIAFLGAMLLPAAAVLRLEVEAGLPRSRLGCAAVLAGALLPAALLPAQIVSANVCLGALVCAPARPFILLTHLGTGALLLLTAVPAVGLVVRRWPAGAWRRAVPSAGLLLLAMAFLHLAGVLLRVGGADAYRPVHDVAEAALMVLLLRAATRQIRRESLDHAHEGTAAPVLEAQLAGAPARAVLMEEEGAGVARVGVAAAPLLAAQAMAGVPDDAMAPLVAAESNALMDDPVQLAQISERALADLRDQGLYRQPQLRRRNLADRLQVPEYLLSRALNASTGHSFIELVNGLRIEEAKRRLRNGSERITTIGYDVGFNSLAAFNRTFREATGQSPSEYRLAPQSGRAEPPPLGGEVLAA